MANKLSIIFTTLAGICFISGLAILKTKGLLCVDRVLSSKKKRYLAVGILLSVSLLFGGIIIHGHDIEA